MIVSEVNPGEADAIREALSAAGDIEVVGYAQDGLEVAQLSYRLRPDVALVWEDLSGLRGQEACELIARSAPEVTCIMLVRGEDSAAREAAMMAGARAMVGVGDLSSLPEVIRRLVTVRQEMPESALAAVTDPGRAPLVVMVTGASGGAGKTTIAVNLAAAMAKKEGERVVLVEAPGQLGDATVLLDVPANRGILDLLLAEDMDHDLVAGSVLRHDSGIALLPSLSPDGLEELAQIDRVTVGSVSVLLGILKRLYSTIVVDCAPTIWPHASYIARRSHIVVLVTTAADLAAVRNAGTLSDLLTVAGVSKDRIIPVVNKVARGGVFGPEDLASTAGWQEYVVIPEDSGSCAAAVNEGTPLVLRSPSSAAARAIMELAEKVMEKGRRIAGGGVSHAPQAGVADEKEVIGNGPSSS